MDYMDSILKPFLSGFKNFNVNTSADYMVLLWALLCFCFIGTVRHGQKMRRQRVRDRNAANGPEVETGHLHPCGMSPDHLAIKCLLLVKLAIRAFAGVWCCALVS